MRRVIMLLPEPDLLQLANCHKYLTRGGDNAYSDVYTMTTIVGACADVDKLLIIGHGSIGGFHLATVDEVVASIIASGISLTGRKKVAFDTCYAGNRGPQGDLTSALHAVRTGLKKHDFNCNLELSGVTGPSVTIGRPDDKRLVVDPARIPQARNLQATKTKLHQVNLFAQRDDWEENTPSATLKLWAAQEYARLLPFAIDFRNALGPNLDMTAGRKVKLQV